jgi:hypothetical protein
MSRFELIKVKVETFRSIKEEINIFLLDMINISIFPFWVLVLVNKESPYSLEELSMIYKSL